MKRFLSASVCALALVFVAGNGLRAEPILPKDVKWTYNWAPGAPAVTGDGNPAAGVTFTNEPTGDAIGDSDIVATNLRVFSAAPGATPDNITAGNYKLVLNVTTKDATDTTVTRALTFTGQLKGAFSKDNSNITNVFGPDVTQEAVLGAYTFRVTLTSYTPPGPPNQSNAGSISAHVTLSPVHGVPEPSSILLSCLGGLSCVGAAWRRKYRARG